MTEPTPAGTGTLTTGGAVASVAPTRAAFATGTLTTGAISMSSTPPPTPVLPPPPPAVYTPPLSVLYPATPIFDEWHVWWAGMLLGWKPPARGAPSLPTSAWSLTGLEGWLTLPASEARNTDRQSRWGSFAGLQTFGTRAIEATFEYTGYGSVGVLRELRRVLTPQEDPQEQRLWIWAGTSRPEFCMARLDKVSIPSDLDFSLGYHRVTVQWIATDPVRYGEVEHSAETGLSPPASTGGLRFPLAFTTPGLSFGAGAGGAGILPVDNQGLLAVWPQLTVHGPVSGPVIEQLESGRRLQFSTDLALGLGETMLIDTNNRYASQGGLSRAHLMLVREWFTMPPGFSRLRFSAADHDPAAKLVAAWRTAAII